MKPRRADCKICGEAALVEGEDGHVFGTLDGISS